MQRMIQSTIIGTVALFGLQAAANNHNTHLITPTSKLAGPQGWNVGLRMRYRESKAPGHQLMYGKKYPVAEKHSVRKNIADADRQLERALKHYRKTGNDSALEGVFAALGAQRFITAHSAESAGVIPPSKAEKKLRTAAERRVAAAVPDLVASRAARFIKRFIEAGNSDAAKVVVDSVPFNEQLALRDAIGNMAPAKGDRIGARRAEALWRAYGRTQSILFEGTIQKPNYGRIFPGSKSTELYNLFTVESSRIK